MNSIPLCVDVDGTLLKTDLLHESLIAYIKKNPVIGWFHVLCWVIAGKARLKRELALRVNLELHELPMHPQIIEFIRGEQEKGREVYLASASDFKYVSGLSVFLGLTTTPFASDGSYNLRGSNKAKTLIDRFGSEGFDYIGNDATDIQIWKESRIAYVISSKKNFIRYCGSLLPNLRVLEAKSPRIRDFLRGIRIHQWLKNILVFVPVVLAHKITQESALLHACLAFISFSLCASGVYVTNDLLDLEADRHHPRKRRRPWAAGTLSIVSAAIVAPLLFLSAILIGASISKFFVSLLFLYIVMTFSYSFYLKQIALVDIIVLAALYTLRILAGGVATDTSPSKWLLAVSMFLFFSLACVKRFSEIQLMLKSTNAKLKGRAYQAEDAEQISMFGASSGFISVLVLALYVSSKEVTMLYKTPEIIWLACPLMLYWISRVWLLARRGLVHDDPLVFALKDKVTYFILLGLLCIFIFAI